MITDWVDTLRLALRIEDPVDIDLILEVASDTAHDVAPAAGPITAYMLGVAVAQGARPDHVAGVVRELALGWREHP